MAHPIPTPDPEPRKPEVVLLCGPPRSGKTTAAARLVEEVRRAGGIVGGFLARGLWDDEMRSGFDLEILDRDERVPLCRTVGRSMGPAKVDLSRPDGQRVGHFRFDPAGMAAGERALRRAMATPPTLVVVDEIGFLELEGGGWHPLLVQMLPAAAPLLLVVRDELETPIRQRYGLVGCRRFDAARPPRSADLLEDA